MFSFQLLHIIMQIASQNRSVLGIGPEYNYFTQGKYSIFLRGEKYLLNPRAKPLGLKGIFHPSGMHNVLYRSNNYTRDILSIIPRAQKSEYNCSSNLHPLDVVIRGYFFACITSFFIIHTVEITTMQIYTCATVKVQIELSISIV